MDLKSLKEKTIERVQDLSNKGLLFEKQTEVATNGKNLIDIYIYLINQARTEQEIEVIANLIKGQSEGFNFQRVPTITTNTITVLEPSKYQHGEISSNHHKVIICDNTKEKEHWEKTQNEIEKLKKDKPDGYQQKIDNLKKQQFILDSDNLDVLNNLLCDKTIRDHGGIDVIYIDPPYNTGDLTLGYRDVREKNEWLNFMKARLEKARDLLANDGTIFISIDDNMLGYLIVICDEIFGKDAYITCLPRISTTSGKNDEKLIGRSHDYILIYSNLVKFNKDIDFEQSHYYNDDNDIHGLYQTNVVLDSTSLPYVKSLDFPINFKNKTYLPGDTINLVGKVCWRWSKEKVEFGIKNNLIIEKNGRLYTKGYLEYEIKKINGKYEFIKKEVGKTIRSLIFDENDESLTNEKFGNRLGTKELYSILPNTVFSFAKPTSLIKKLVSFIPTNDEIYFLDFFAGSGTSLQAVANIKNVKAYICTKLYDYFELRKDDGSISTWHNIGEDVMLERITRTFLGINKDGKKLTGKECPWLLEHKPYNQPFDVFTTKQYDISLNSKINSYDIIDLSIYGYDKKLSKKDSEKIINQNFDVLLSHLNKKSY